MEGLADLATVGSLTKAKGALKLFLRFMKSRVRDAAVDVAANQAGNAVAERYGEEAGFVTQEFVSAALSRGTSRQTKTQLGFAADRSGIKPQSTGRWAKGSYKSAEESLIAHFNKHGVSVGAKDVDQYLRKATNFSGQLRGASKSPIKGATPNVMRYKKLGKFIDLDNLGNIISFGVL